MPARQRTHQGRLRRAAALRGFTLIELMVVVGVLGVIALLAGPSFMDMIVMQRLRGINAQLVTDLQFARSEAVARGRIVRLHFGVAADKTCYVLYTAAGNGTARCNCTNTGAVCTSAETREIRTVNVPSATRVAINLTDGPRPNGVLDPAFGYDPVTGGLVSVVSDSTSTPPTSVVIETSVDEPRTLRTNIAETGRPSVCAPSSSSLGVAACPPPP